MPSQVARQMKLICLFVPLLTGIGFTTACKRRDPEAAGLLNPGEALLNPGETGQKNVAGKAYVVTCVRVEDTKKSAETQEQFLWELVEEGADVAEMRDFRADLSRVVGSSKEFVERDMDGKGAIDQQGQIHIATPAALLTAEYLGEASQLASGRSHQGVMSLKSGGGDQGFVVECAVAAQ